MFSKLVLATSLFALVAGCEGANSSGSWTTDGPGLKHLDNGAVYCDIPSPTGDVPFNAAAGVTLRDEMMKIASQPQPGIGFIVVSNASEAESMCLDWSPIVPAGVGEEGQPYPAYCPLSVQDPAHDKYCADKTTESTCADVTHDFKDAAGYPRCWDVTAEDGASACSPKADGSVTCKLASFEAVTADPTLKIRWQNQALCSPEGVFVGWSCAG